MWKAKFNLKLLFGAFTTGLYTGAYLCPKALILQEGRFQSANSNNSIALNGRKSAALQVW